MGGNSSGEVYQQSDPASPEIVQELLDADSEWMDQSDIVKLTFKGILHVLKA
jgi:hypothetical protein